MTLEAIHRIIDEYESFEGNDLTLEKKNIDKVKHIIEDSETSTLFKNLTKKEYLLKLNYSDLVELNDKLQLLKNTVQEAKEEIDIDEFYKRGEIINFDKLRKDFKKRNLKKRYPNFDIDKYEQIIRNPPLEIKNFNGETIMFDKFTARKILIAINQMIFNEMDLYISNVGSEGAGKSCWSSQLILFIYTILKEVRLIQYEYDVKKLFFSSLKSLIDIMDTQEDNDYFRILALDEAYELNRSNFREDNSKLFKDDMRSSRKMQRIIQLNLPQLGELELAIIQTRLNFIFYTRMDNDVETGTVKKGLVDFYIIPRGSKIYSTVHRREISKAEIINSISAIMKDKNDSYKGLPKNCLIHSFTFQGIWGFDKDKYDVHIKKENRKRRTDTDVKIGNYMLYLIYRYMPDLKNWSKMDKSIQADKKAYYSLQKFFRGVKVKFIENEKLESDMQRRLELE